LKINCRAKTQAEYHTSNWIHCTDVYLRCPYQRRDSERCPCEMNVQLLPFPESDLCCVYTVLPECRRTVREHSSVVYCTSFLECSTPASPTQLVTNTLRHQKISTTVSEFIFNLVTENACQHYCVISLKNLTRDDLIVLFIYRLICNTSVFIFSSC